MAVLTKREREQLEVIEAELASSPPWSVEIRQGHRHKVVYWDAGGARGQTVLASSPSCSRHLVALRADVRRAIRRAAPQR